MEPAEPEAPIIGGIVYLDAAPIAVAEPFVQRGLVTAPATCIIFVPTEHGRVHRTIFPAGPGVYLQLTRDEVPGAMKVLEALSIGWSPAHTEAVMRTLG